MHNIRKGSFTVEAACLMPVILLVIIGTIYLCFYVHNRAWLTAAAYEAAITGSAEGIKRDGSPEKTARQRAEELVEIPLFGAENLQVEANVKGKEVKVVYEADTNAVYGGMSWHLQAQGSAKVIEPVKYIRRLRELKKVVSAGKGEP